MLAAYAISLALIHAQYIRAQVLPAGVTPGGNSSDLTIQLSSGDTREYLLMSLEATMTLFEWA
jgi:hypothetical protein